MYRRLSRCLLLYTFSRILEILLTFASTRFEAKIAFFSNSIISVLRKKKENFYIILQKKKKEKIPSKF